MQTVAEAVARWRGARTGQPEDDEREGGRPPGWLDFVLSVRDTVKHPTPTLRLLPGMLQLAFGEGKRLQRRQPSSARRGKGVGSRAYLDLGVGRYKCPLLLSFHTTRRFLCVDVRTVLVRGTSSTTRAAPHKASRRVAALSRHSSPPAALSRRSDRLLKARLRLRERPHVRRRPNWHGRGRRPEALAPTAPGRGIQQEQECVQLVCASTVMTGRFCRLLRTFH